MAESVLGAGIVAASSGLAFDTVYQLKISITLYPSITTTLPTQCSSILLLGSIIAHNSFIYYNGGDYPDADTVSGMFPLPVNYILSAGESKTFATYKYPYFRTTSATEIITNITQSSVYVTISFDSDGKTLTFDTGGTAIFSSTTALMIIPCTVSTITTFGV